MIGKFMSGMCLLLAVMAHADTAAAVGDGGREEILERLQELQRQVAGQQAEINSLKARLARAEEERSEIRREVDEVVDSPSLAQVRTVGPVTVFQPHIEAIDFRGGLELGYLRGRQRSADGNKTLKTSSFYTGFRLGATWYTHESWKVSAGLVTVAETGDPRPARQVWSRRYPFAAGDIALDYAYVEHRFDTAGLIIGQQHNPFRTADVLWDRDVRPIGITAGYTFEDWFVTAGWYNLLNTGWHEERNLQLWAGQGGYSREMDDFDFSIAAAWYRTSSDYGDIVVGDPAAGMDTVDLLAEVGTDIADWRVAVQGQLWHNLRAGRGRHSQTLRTVVDPDGGTTVLVPRDDIDPKNNDLGLSLGLTGEWAGFRLGYSYTRVEADSFVEALVDELTAVNNHVNVKGHRIGLGYRFTEHLRIGCTYRRLAEIRGRDKADIFDFTLRYDY